MVKSCKILKFPTFLLGTDRLTLTRPRGAFAPKNPIEELFAAIGSDTLLIEGELVVTATSFAKDFIKCIDEIRNENDIVDMWCIDPSLARELFILFKEVVYGGDLASEEENENEYVSEPDEVDDDDESCVSD